MTLLLENFLKRENVSCQRHDGLILFDYTKECQFKRDWDEITLNARGIVFEEATGEVICLPFKKFFNLTEPECLIENLPKDESFLTQTKMDGSFGLVYWYKGTWRVNTRGSFFSDQAVWAKKWLDENIDTTWMVPGFTYLFEIIYANNRIVVDYGGKDFLCLLGIMHNKTGLETPYGELVASAYKMGCPVVEAHPFKSLEELFAAQKKLTANEEGFVITYPRTGLKFKLKGSEYCKIHRMISHLTPLSFWRAIDYEGTQEIPLEYLAGLPEEFRTTVDALTEITERLHKEKLAEVLALVETVPPEFHKKGRDLPNPERRARYEYVMNTFGPDKGSSVLFCLDGRFDKIKKAIHDEVRPNGNRYEGLELDARIMNALRDEG